MGRSPSPKAVLKSLLLVLIADRFLPLPAAQLLGSPRPTLLVLRRPKLSAELSSVTRMRMKRVWKFWTLAGMPSMRLSPQRSRPV